MADFSVDTQALDSLGQNLQRYGDDEISRAAPYCRQYAGSLAGMTGLLSILDGPVQALAGTYADHYASMARVVSGTGGGLRSTAAHYVNVDQAARAKFDSLAPAELGEVRTEIRGDVDRQRPVDPQLIEALKQASRASAASESLRKVARRVDAGELTWAEVVSGSSTDPGVVALTGDAQQAARAQFENADWSGLGQPQGAATKSTWIPRSWNDNDE